MCTLDVISLSRAAAVFTDDYADNYQVVGGIPRLVVRQKNNETMQARIWHRFTHSDSSCTFVNYRISHVTTNNGNNLTDEEVLRRYQLTYDGVFKASVSANISNDKIYVEAFNGEVWGGARHYLIDYSYEKLVNETAVNDTIHNSDSAPVLTLSINLDDVQKD